MFERKTTLRWGEAHPFWDCHVGDDAQEQSGVDPEVMRTISVMVDEETGEIMLNTGYAPGTEPDQNEHALFAEVEDELTDLFLAEMRGGYLDDPAYDAFKARHAAPSP